MTEKTESLGLNTNTNYLKSAIQRIYSDDDDLIILGLTGRTGSGCSTVAALLKSDKENLKHNLCDTGDPTSNDQRKERIIKKHFEATWSSFELIQVRSVITTFLLDQDITKAIDFTNLLLELEENQKEQFKDLILKTQTLYNSAKQEPSFSSTFYTKILPQEAQKIKGILSESNFVKLYQTIGRNLRLSGDPYNKDLIEGKFFTLAERINEIITLIRKENARNSKSTFIVIDAIRSPLEAIYFQDKYTSFFLLAVSCPENDRLTRLRSLKYSEQDIELIDNIEYTSKDLNDIEYFSVQDIAACIQRADLYVNNPQIKSSVNQYQYLANQLIRFISLIKRPGIVTPTAIERCMQVAYTAKLNSGCISRQVGAIVTNDEYAIRSIGWNDVPAGQVPCNLRNRDDLLGGKDSNAYSHYEKTDVTYLKHFGESTKKFIQVVDGRNKSFCFKSEYNQFKKDKNQVHTRSLHAEENAFLQISKYGGMAITNGYLFTTASPCELCSKKAYQLGIKKIYYIDPYPGIAISHILRGGQQNPELELFTGAIGRAFHRLYTSIVPYKDELNALKLIS